MGSILVAHHRRQEVLLEPVGVVDDVAAGREQAGRFALPACVSQAGPVRPNSGPVVVEKDLGHAGGLLQGGGAPARCNSRPA